ncbi:hypothetical protein [Clostridium beijerinckii]|uniref:Uncharacterized protein n=1 Tax=Clostridium beijerinckii TaxID=1520 RepID=A0A1S8S9X7_CLOBE|nr:hypothetical protein [Clostridium beijerinckii]NRY60865.1 hypothetical protein [Clostridium beijerinckii]OOM62308.1 hypothetical protein CLBCK_18460 [Clostridium beijerinckii]
MNRYFKYEKTLVDNFIKNLDSFETIIKEMPIRWGNIDVVNINCSSLPFNADQCICLSKPSNAKIFMKIKNKRPITFNTLFNGLGLSESTFNSSIHELLKVNLIKEKDNKYIRNMYFSLQNVMIYGYEAKLHNFNKAYFQATENRKYVDYSYLVFPNDIAKKIHEKHSHELILNSIGLIGVDTYKNTLYIKAKKAKEMKSYTRLLNLVKSQAINTEK